MSATQYPTSPSRVVGAKSGSPVAAPVRGGAVMLPVPQGSVRIVQQLPGSMGQVGSPARGNPQSPGQVLSPTRVMQANRSGAVVQPAGSFTAVPPTGSLRAGSFNAAPPNAGLTGSIRMMPGGQGGSPVRVQQTMVQQSRAPQTASMTQQAPAPPAASMTMSAPPSTVSQPVGSIPSPTTTTMASQSGQVASSTSMTMQSNSTKFTSNAFNALDKNHDGGITREEFMANVGKQPNQGINTVLNSTLVQRPTTADPEVATSLFDGAFDNGVIIKGSWLTWQSGTKVRISFPSSTQIVLDQKGMVSEGELQQGGTIVWGDGDIWRKADTIKISGPAEIQTTQVVQPIKVQAPVPSVLSNPQEAALFEGKWSCGAIKGDILTWPSGKETRLVFLGHSVIQMEHDGKMHKGVLEQGEVHWDDGDKWTKAGHATSATCCIGWFG